MHQVHRVPCDGAVLRNGMEEVLSFARLAKLGDAYNGLASVKTHAVLDAAPAKTPARFPGHRLLARLHRPAELAHRVFEDLASHGWAVLHVVHPFEAASTLADGTFVTFTDEKNAMRPGIMDVLNEWGPEGGDDGQGRGRHRRCGEGKAAARLSRHLEEHRSSGEAVGARREAGARSAAEERARVGAGVAARSVAARRRRPFDGRRDGGAVLRRGPALQGGLNFDGIPQYGTMIDTPMPAPFLMVYSGRPGRAGASDIIYRRSASKYYRVDVADTLHIDFSEMNMWGGPLRPARRVRQDRSGARRRADAPHRARVSSAQEILGRTSLLLSGDAQPMRRPYGHEKSKRYQEMKQVPLFVFNREGKLVGPLELPRVEKTDAEWQDLLTPEQFAVARAHGTERPFCGTLLDNKRAGVYSCICCGLPLFASNAKFDSGTGWPSFFQPIADENVATHTGSQLRHGARRDSLRALRLPSRSRVSRRPGADAAAALRELGVAEIYRRRPAFAARRPRRGLVRPSVFLGAACRVSSSPRWFSRPARFAGRSMPAAIGWRGSYSITSQPPGSCSIVVMP